MGLSRAGVRPHKMNIIFSENISNTCQDNLDRIYFHKGSC